MGNYRVAFHLDEGHKARLDLVLGNIGHLLSDLGPEGVEVELVANAGGITAFLKADNLHLEQIKSLAAQGVRFCVCANSMRQQALTPDAFLEEVAIVPSGVGELVKKQALGWAYIRP